MAWESTPEANTGPFTRVPLLPKPEESVALPSNFQWATGFWLGGVGVGVGDGVGVGVGGVLSVTQLFLVIL